MPLVQTDFKRMYLVSNKPEMESPPPVIRKEGATNDSDLPPASSNNGQYICPQCGFSFISQQNLNEHIKTSHNSNLFQCEKCNFSTDNLELYKTHYETQHGSNKRKRNDDDDKVNEPNAKRQNVEEPCIACGNNGEDTVQSVNNDEDVGRNTLKSKRIGKTKRPTYFPYNSQKLSRTKRADNDVIGKKLQQMEKDNLKRTVAVSAKRTLDEDLSDIEDNEKDEDYLPKKKTIKRK